MFQPSGNGPPGGQPVPRQIPRQMQQPMGGSQRMPPGANMGDFGAAPQAGMVGMNPGNIPMQRGAGGQSHPHQHCSILKLCYLPSYCCLNNACDDQ